MPELNSVSENRTGYFPFSSFCWKMKELYPSMVPDLMDCIEPELSRMKAISVRLLADVASVMGGGAMSGTRCPRYLELYRRGRSLSVLGGWRGEK